MLSHFHGAFDSLQYPGVVCSWMDRGSEDIHMCNVIAALTGKPSEGGKKAEIMVVWGSVLFYQQIQRSLGVLHFCTYLLWYLEVLYNFCSKWQNVKLC